LLVLALVLDLGLNSLEDTDSSGEVVDPSCGPEGSLEDGRGRDEVIGEGVVQVALFGNISKSVRFMLRVYTSVIDVWTYGLYGHVDIVCLGCRMMMVMMMMMMMQWGRGRRAHVELLLGVRMEWSERVAVHSFIQSFIHGGRRCFVWYIGRAGQGTKGQRE
jgi:hypothetical protein